MSENSPCTLCPKGWAWCVEDCCFIDSYGSCNDCREPLAPIKKAVFEIKVWKNRDNLLFDPLGVYGLTSKANILLDLEADYEKLSFWEFKRWNRKRKRGFWYNPEILRDALKFLRFFRKTEVELDYYVPKQVLPLFISLTRDLYLAVAPRIKT